ncbi:hypothetical protein CROQUDRAFT_13537, partial [Cronartium quercuum f. sp. fusiforme G11]
LAPLLTNSSTHHTLVAMDSNLHHPLWNPPQYQHSHREADRLIRMMAAEGLDLQSEPHVPTFHPSNTSHTSTTIDLLWLSEACMEWAVTCKTDVNHTHSHLSDHAAITTELQIPA